MTEILKFDYVSGELEIKVKLDKRITLIEFINFLEKFEDNSPMMKKDNDKATASAPTEAPPVTDDDTTSEEKPEISTDGFRNLQEDKLTTPPDILIRHCIQAAMENEKRSFQSMLHFVYGEYIPNPNTKLFNAFKNVWDNEVVHD